MCDAEPSWSIAWAMVRTGERIQVVVELETASEPIRGAVRTMAAHRPFEGWMELTAALEDARTASQDGHASDEPGRQRARPLRRTP